MSFEIHTMIVVFGNISYSYLDTRHPTLDVDKRRLRTQIIQKHDAISFPEVLLCDATKPAEQNLL